MESCRSGHSENSIDGVPWQYSSARTGTGSRALIVFSRVGQLNGRLQVQGAKMSSLLPSGRSSSILSQPEWQGRARFCAVAPPPFKKAMSREHSSGLMAFGVM